MLTLEVLTKAMDDAYKAPRRQLVYVCSQTEYDWRAAHDALPAGDVKVIISKTIPTK